MMHYLLRVRNQLLDTKSSLSVVDKNTQYDGRTLKRKIEAYMALILRLGLEAGEDVAILPERSVEWVCFMYALMYSGHPPLLLDIRMDDETLEKVVGEGVLTIASTERKLAHRTIRNLEDVAESDEHDGLLKAAIIRDDAVLFTAHTSGTTGTPKKVPYFNQHISWAVDEYERVYGFDDKKSILFSLPYHYCYSVIPSCIVPFALGKKTIIAPEASTAADIAQLIHDYEVEILVVNPVFYSELSLMDLSKYNFGSLKICDSGGESIPLPVVHRLKEQTDVLITEGYGLTETTSLTHFLLPDDKGILRIGSVGKACRAVETRIMSRESQQVLQGEIGELYIRGPMVAQYDNTVDRDIEWFPTGDLFYEDEDGFFYFVSRKTDVPDVEPERVLKISQAVMSLLDDTTIRDIAYVFKDQQGLTLLVVADTVEEERDALTKSITARFLKATDETAEIKYVASLPRTSTGKVKKRSL